MKTLQKIISRYLYYTTATVVAVIFFIVVVIQFNSEQKRTYQDSIKVFHLISNKLAENEQELEEVEAEYRQTCLYNAKVIARMIESDPEILNDMERLQELAVLLEIDEIHIFDEKGCIFTGTRPEYYGYTMYAGEQIQFFEPMLEDKTLCLVQDIMPNTAEGKMMQYSAVWSENGEYIVQIGMEPVNVRKVTEKNEISYVFSTFKVNADIDYYDINPENGVILGSTNPESIGHNIEELGLDFDRIIDDRDGFHAIFNDRICFCVFEKVGENYLGRIIPADYLYRRIPSVLFGLAGCLLLMGFIMIYAVTRHLNKYVVSEIHEINDKLQMIINGKYDATIEARSSEDFSALSDYLNTMLRSILNNNVKMAYVLSKTNLPIGIYDYNNSTTVGRVHFTEYIPQIFCLTEEKMEELSSNHKCFVEFLEEVKCSSVAEESNVYQIGEKYITLEEIRNNDDVFGVVMDITQEVKKRKELETERDIDPLTGLLNRRGFDIRQAKILEDYESIDYYAYVMIDADGLKKVNDTYGHESGDAYLKKIAELIRSFGTEGSLASRQGGDEFVLLLYGYQRKEDLETAIEELKDLQNNCSVLLDKNVSVKLRFSLGYCMGKGPADYQAMLKEADEKMYRNKLERRKQAEVF
ncbi:MAG: diguanylate cyclase [Lachnospiraceae bacterium]